MLKITPQIIIPKLFFLVCSILISINIIELFPHQIGTLDFVMQLALWLICLALFFSLKQPQTVNPTDSDLNLFTIEQPRSLLLCRIGLLTFFLDYSFKLFSI